MICHRVKSVYSKARMEHPAKIWPWKSTCHGSLLCLCRVTDEMIISRTNCAPWIHKCTSQCGTPRLDNVQIWMFFISTAWLLFNIFFIIQAFFVICSFTLSQTCKFVPPCGTHGRRCFLTPAAIRCTSKIKTKVFAQCNISWTAHVVCKVSRRTVTITIDWIVLKYWRGGSARERPKSLTQDLVKWQIDFLIKTGWHVKKRRVWHKMVALLLRNDRWFNICFVVNENSPIGYWNFAKDLKHGQFIDNRTLAKFQQFFLISPFLNSTCNIICVCAFLTTQERSSVNFAT